MNKVILSGRVGVEPTIREANGVKVASFSFATSEKYKDKGGQTQTVTDWHDIVMWRNIAELCEKYVHKGDKLLIEGKIKQRNWEDQDGKKHYVTEVIGEHMEFIGGKPQSSPTQSSLPNDLPPNEDGDNLPF